MCIIIDTNTFASVMNTASADHSDFKPVYDWIFKRNGVAVYGGSKYKKELSMDKGMLNLLAILSKKNKTYTCNDAEVDKEEARIIKLSPKSFNDQHLAAIVVVSGCKIICSKNSGDFAELKNKKYYPKGVCSPKIYCKEKNKSILNDKNISTNYKSRIKLTKKQKIDIDLKTSRKNK